MIASARADKPSVRHAVEMAALAAALIASFFGGWWLSLRQNSPPVAITAPGPRSTVVLAGSSSTPGDVDGTEHAGNSDVVAVNYPRQLEPRAIAARSEMIQRDANAIRAECQSAADGDWGQWQEKTAGYRADLKQRVGALKQLDKPRALDSLYEPLEGRDKFPLFEVGAREHLNYLFDPALLDDFRRTRAVVAAQRWLGRQGIDLIFVPVPKMTEVYIEHFLDSCPPDGNIAPPVRQALLELLDSGVEVVDGWRLFRSLRNADREYLYNTADTHWAPRGMRIMAKEVADRIARYEFGARARYGMPIVRCTPGPYTPGFKSADPTLRFGWFALTKEQRKLAETAQTTIQSQVTDLTGSPLSDDTKSPVVLIGHSYTYCFREQLIRELNLRVHTLSLGGATTESFGDFLRMPSILKNCRVVVWVISED
jgi:hypothetical protein